MSVTDTNDEDLPGFAASMLHDGAEKVFSAAGVALAADGVIQSDQTKAFAQIAVGVAMWGATWAYRWYMNRHRAKQLHLAIQAPAGMAAPPKAVS